MKVRRVRTMSLLVGSENLKKEKSANRRMGMEAIRKQSWSLSEDDYQIKSIMYCE